MYSSRSYKKPQSNARRWQIGAVAGVAVAIVGVGLGVASAAEAVPTVNCPAVNINVAVPAQAQAEIQSNLQLLNTQINEANNRLKSSVGQGGANFVQNAILGPLADKRFATINRMETAIGRNAAKPDLNAEGLKTCTLNQGGGASAAQPTAVPSAAAGGNAGNAGNGAASGVGNISCPQVNVNVAVPQSAAAEVQRNLELLNTQIAEAQKRLESSVGQGGANFVQNAILGPLADKRFATINRIETAIGRQSAKPNLNAEGLKTCTVGNSAGAAQGTGVQVQDAAAVAASAGKIVCPAVNINVAVPAQAAAEVQRNLDLLNTQIAESQKRLETSVGQGGAAFVQNAILGPLADKRNSTINRIETAIGRNAAKPDLNAEGLRNCTVQK
jgi:F0F1-type ATP synthase membrane subunit b/b'